MFNLFFKFNREYIHKKIVIHNLNISEDKTEKHIEDYKNSFTLGQLFLNKGKSFKTDSLRCLIKKKNFWVLF